MRWKSLCYFSDFRFLIPIIIINIILILLFCQWFPLGFLKLSIIMNFENCLQSAYIILLKIYKIILFHKQIRHNKFVNYVRTNNIIFIRCYYTNLYLILFWCWWMKSFCFFYLHVSTRCLTSIGVFEVDNSS